MIFNLVCLFSPRSYQMPSELSSFQVLIISCTRECRKNSFAPFVEPSFDMLPESYFRDDGVEEATTESGGSECEEGETISHAGGTEGVDVPAHGASSAHTVISPRAVSNSRRKRKRKNSQSEKKQSASSKSPPPTSPVEEKQVMLRANPSPPNPASPVSITSPCSPVSALASDCTPRSHADASCDSSAVISLTTPPTSKSTSQWISIEKKRKNSNVVVQDSGSRNHRGNESSEVALLRANSVPTSDQSHQMQRQSSLTTTTPLSAPSNGTGRSKKIRNDQTRTRLMNKFNAITGHPEESLDAKKVENDSPPAQIDTRRPWTRISNGYVIWMKQ